MAFRIYGYPLIFTTLANLNYFKFQWFGALFYFPKSQVAIRVRFKGKKKSGHLVTQRPFRFKWEAHSRGASCTISNTQKLQEADLKLMNDKKKPIANDSMFLSSFF